MRQITIDFGSQTYPLFAGYIGEHNATELIAIKPTDLSGDMYSFVFMTNGEVIHSKYFYDDEELVIPLWQQLTLDNELYVQLEAYDKNGDYIGKSSKVKLVFSSSVHGIDVIADSDNPDVYSEIALNSWFRETLEDNADTLDKLSTSEDGKLLFNGKLIEGSSGEIEEGSGLTDEQLENLEKNTENRHWHYNKSTLDLFGINYANTLPTFKGSVLVTNEYVNSAVKGYALKSEVYTKKEVYTKDEIDDKGFITADQLPESGGGGIMVETDPTVPAWAKRSEPPKYTAEDVGAMPFDTYIPTSEDIKGEVETALEEAKINGDFKGEKGDKGDDYVLTNEDKKEIVDLLIDELPYWSEKAGGY